MNLHYKQLASLSSLPFNKTAPVTTTHSEQVAAGEDVSSDLIQWMKAKDSRWNVLGLHKAGLARTLLYLTGAFALAPFDRDTFILFHRPVGRNSDTHTLLPWWEVSSYPLPTNSPIFRNQ